MPDMEYMIPNLYSKNLDTLNFPNNLNLEFDYIYTHACNSVYSCAVWQLQRTHVRTLKNVFGSSRTKPEQSEARSCDGWEKELAHLGQTNVHFGPSQSYMAA